MEEHFDETIVKSTEIYIEVTKLTPVQEERDEERYEVADRRSAAELETRYSYYGRATELPARLSARELDGDAVAALKRFSYQPSIVVVNTTKF